MMAITPISPHYPVQNDSNRHGRGSLQQERRAVEDASNNSRLDDIRPTHLVTSSFKTHLLDALFTTMGGSADCLARGHHLDIYI